MDVSHITGIQILSLDPLKQQRIIYVSNVLQIQNVGMHRNGYHYLLGGLVSTLHRHALNYNMDCHLTIVIRSFTTSQYYVSK